MKKLLFALGMTASVLVSACDATMAGAVNTALQNQQGKPQSPAPAASAPTAAASANANATVGGDPFVQGRKWTYTLSTKAAGITTAGEITIEVAELTADKATIKTTSTVAGVTTSNSTTVDRKNTNPWAGMNLGGSGSASTPTATSDETITVAAGTFACTKSTYAITQATGSGTVDFWLNKDKGLIKEIVTIKSNAAASLPAGISLPGGMNLDLTTTTTIELKSVTP